MNSGQANRTPLGIRILGRVALVISIAVLIVFAALRLMDMVDGSSPADAFGIRYVHHPWAALIHIIPGILFLVFVPLQFTERIRRRNIRFHRLLGRVLVVLAAFSGVYALVVAFLLPAFGGISTVAATVFFGLIYLVALAKAFVHIRHKRVRLHQQWMTRVVALAMGVATIRLYILIFTAFGGLGFEEVFGTAFWLGLSTNLLIAEVWINQIQNPARRPAPHGSPR